MTLNTRDNVSAGVMVALIIAVLCGLVAWSTAGDRAECHAKGGSYHYDQIFKRWSCEVPR